MLAASNARNEETPAATSAILFRDSRCPNLKPRAQTLSQKNRRLRRSEHGLALNQNPEGGRDLCLRLRLRLRLLLFRCGSVLATRKPPLLSSLGGSLSGGLEFPAEIPLADRRCRFAVAPARCPPPQDSPCISRRPLLWQGDGPVTYLPWRAGV
jgi:hypothetical protein